MSSRTYSSRVTGAGSFTILVAALSVAASGCGGATDSSLAPTALENPEQVAAVLPKGVTMETPVVPDKRYGDTSKTVAEALMCLRAQVKNGVLFAGYAGPEIHFDNEPAAKIKPSRTAKKVQKPPVVIKLAH